MYLFFLNLLYHPILFLCSRQLLFSKTISVSLTFFLNLTAFFFYSTSVISDRKYCLLDHECPLCLIDKSQSGKKIFLNNMMHSTFLSGCYSCILYQSLHFLLQFLIAFFFFFFLTCMTSLFLFAAEVRHCLCMIFLTTYNIQQRQAVQSDHRRSEAGGRPVSFDP